MLKYIASIILLCIVGAKMTTAGKLFGTQQRSIQSSPKYLHLANLLRRHIVLRHLRPGDLLGTEAELVAKYGVSRVTVRQALRVLERQGSISREKARGTFIKKSIAPKPGRDVVRGTVVLACSNEQADQAEEDHAFATIVRAIERHLTERNFTSRLLGFGADKHADRIRLRELDRKNDLEGICTIGPCLEPYRDDLPDVPIVTSCTFLPTKPPWVGGNARLACSACINHLLANGHLDIAIICSAGLDRDAYALFAEAYLAELEAAGVPYARSLMYHAYPGQPLDQLARQILGGSKRPTAAFAENWKVCQAILTAASELKIRVPEDLSLVAFGHNALQITYPLAITAYVPDQETIGLDIVKLLTAIVDGKTPATRQIEVPGSLVKRDSVRSIGPSLVPDKRGPTHSDTDL